MENGTERAGIQRIRPSQSVTREIVALEFVALGRFVGARLVLEFRERPLMQRV